MESYMSTSAKTYLKQTAAVGSAAVLVYSVTKSTALTALTVAVGGVACWLWNKSPAPAPTSVSTQSSQSTPAMCDNCHKTPQFPGSTTCSLTCRNALAQKTAQAAQQAMCNHCGVKPRHPGHSYCGKTCAGLATRVAAVAP